MPKRILSKTFLIIILLSCTGCQNANASEVPNVSEMASLIHVNASQGLADVSEGAWYAEAVIYLYENEIISGTSAAHYTPQGVMNRAMMAAVLWNMAGRPSVTGRIAFADVQMNSQYADAIAWATQENIINGYNNNLFGVDDPATREQIASMLYRYEVSQNGQPAFPGSLRFSDANTVSSWAQPAVAWAVERQIVSGKPENVFDPLAGATRAEAAVMVYQYISGSAVVEKAEYQENSTQNKMENKMQIIVGSNTFTATLADNSSAQALREMIADGPITIDMHDYGGFEKVGPLGADLPANDERMTTELGDIILYQGNNLVIYYAPNTWSFTRLGKIDDVSGLREALGDGSVTITLTIVQ